MSIKQEIYLTKLESDRIIAIDFSLSVTPYKIKGAFSLCTLTILLYCFIHLAIKELLATLDQDIFYLVVQNKGCVECSSLPIVMYYK